MKGEIKVSNLLKKDKGFTLIEIVLVLAIAGLLLVIVFLAVSGAQKSRRDSQRKNDISRVAAALESYASNTSGAYPADQTAFANAIGTGGAYDIKAIDPLSNTAYTYAGLVAPTNSLSAGISYTITGRTYTVCIGLEQGTQTCRDNK